MTEARQAIRDHRARTGEALSFTAFVVSCLAAAIDEDRRMHALRKGRSTLVLYDEVDVTVLVETDVDDDKVPMPHIVRVAEPVEPRAITDDPVSGEEIRRFDADLPALVDAWVAVHRPSSVERR